MNLNEWQNKYMGTSSGAAKSSAPSASVNNMPSNSTNTKSKLSEWQDKYLPDINTPVKKSGGTTLLYNRKINNGDDFSKWYKDTYNLITDAGSYYDRTSGFLYDADDLQKIYSDASKLSDYTQKSGTSVMSVGQNSAKYTGEQKKFLKDNGFSSMTELEKAIENRQGEGKYDKNYGSEYVDKLLEAKKGSEEAIKYLDAHMDEYENADELRAQLVSYGDYIDDLTSAMGQVKDYFNQWENEDEYKNGYKLGKTVKTMAKATANSLAGRYTAASAQLSGSAPTELTKGQSAQQALSGQSLDDYTNDVIIDRLKRANAKSQKADEYYEKASGYENMAKWGKNGFEKLLVSAGIQMPEVLADSAVTLGVGALTGLPGAGLVNMGIRAFGDASHSAREAGLSWDQAELAGWKSAGIEIATEKMFSAVGKLAYGSGYADNMVEKLIDGLNANKPTKVFLKAAASFGEEGLEEVLSDVFNPAFDYIFNLRDKDGKLLDELDSAQIMEDFLVGGIMGLAGMGGQITTDSAKTIIRGMKTNKELAQIFVKEGQTAAEDSAARLLADKYSGKKKLNAYQKGKLGKAVDEARTEQIDAATETEAIRLLQEHDDKYFGGEITANDDTYVSALVKIANGEELSRNERDAFYTLIGGQEMAAQLAAFQIEQRFQTAKDRYDRYDELTTKTEEAPAEEAPVNENAPAELEYREGSTPTWDADNIVESMFPEEVKSGILSATDVETIQGMYDNSGRQMDLNELESMVKDYIIQKEEKTNVRNDDMDGSMGRQSREGSGVESGKVQSRAEGDKGKNGLGEYRADTGRESLRREAESGTESKVSAKELGIEDGTDEKNNSVVPEHKWSKAEKAVAKAFGPASNGFTLVSRNLSLTNGKANGAKTADGKIVVSRSSRLYKSEQLMIHEGGHLYLDDDIQLVDKLRSAAIEEMSEKEIDELTAAYALKWKGLYGDEEAFDRAANGELDAQELEEFNRKYVVEFLCDALGGIDRAGTKGTSKFSEAVRAAFKAETGIDIDALLNGTEAEAKTETEAPKAKTEAEKPRNNGPPEEDFTRYSPDEYDAENASIKQQIEHSREILNRMEVVAKTTAPENLNDGKEAYNFADSIFAAIGYRVQRVGFGDIRISRKDISTGLRYAKSPEERAAISLVPAVLKKGIEIGAHNQHKGRTKNTATFAAPVEINGVRGNMAVLVNRNSDSYNAHRIVLPDGTVFKFSDKKIDTSTERPQGVLENESLAKAADDASRYSIFAEGKNVNSYSAEDTQYTDAEYLAAVERGDTEAAQAMVDEAARRAGYMPEKFYHGTKNAGFTVFEYDKNRQTGTDYGKAFYFTTDYEKAVGYAYSLHNDPKIKIATAEKDALREKFLNDPTAENQKAYLEYKYNGKTIMEMMNGEGELLPGSEVKSVYLKADNPLVVDADGKYYYEVYDKYFEDATKNGNDGIIVNNVIDNPRGKPRKMKVGIVFSAEQIKSADPVTYDDNGNIIPLSERFNAENEDIRYSVEDEAPEMMSAEEVQRRKHFKQTVNSESLTKLNERMARLDGAINGYERTENRSEKMERELAEMKADRAVVEKALKAKKAKTELEKRARKNAKAEAEAALDNLSVRRTTAQSRKAAKQQIFEQFGIESGRAYVGNSIDAFLDKWIEQGKIGSKDIDALEASLMEMGAFKIESANDFAQEVRSRMYNGQISVPAYVVEEFGDDWNAFRQRAFANRIYLSIDSNHAGIDQWTKDLANSFGIGQFDESLDLAAQLENIIDIAEEGKAENMSVYELAERTRRLEGPDVADAYLEEMHDKLMQTLKSFSQSAKIEMETVKKNAYAQIRDDALRKEKAERAAQERAQREFQQKTLKQLQWLKRNQNFMGTDFQEEAKRILADIDTIAVSAANEMNWSDKYNATWEDLAKMYAWAKENDSNFLPNKELENILARIGGTHLDELNASDLENIYKAAVALRTAYYNRNNIIGDELHGTFAEAYEDAVADMREAIKPKNMTGTARKIADSQLNPINRIQRMFGWKEDSAGFQIFGRGLERGERQTKRYVEQANQILDEWLENNKEWVAKADGQGENAIWYELEVPELVKLKMGDKPIFGKTVKVYMTPMQKIYMYLESKNYDNLRHMVGGRTFVDKELYSAGQKSEAFAQGTTISLAPETVKKLVADLTPTEMELATILDRQYFNGYAKTEINRVSNILYGYDRAMSDNYAPIYTNHNYNRAEPGMTQDGTAEGVGHMKTRVQGAKNPTYNISALEAFQKHVSQTSRFVGMAIPAQNAETLLNWHGNGTNMQEEITHNWSQGELDSLKNVMQELQAPTYLEQSEFAGVIGKLMSNYIGGVFGSNITVAAKVLASEPTAAIILGGEYYPSVSQKRAVNTNLISKYTSELDVRIRGYGTPELAAMTLSTSKYMQWVQSHKATKLFLGGGLLQAADIYVTKTMWPWAENRVRDLYPELEVGTQEQIDNGTSPFYKKVAEVYEDAIGYTQSMYDIMHRSDIMRDKNEITRSFTIFHTDSLQAMNLIRKRAGELDTAKAALKKAQSDAEKSAAQAKVNTTAKKMAACVGNVILMNVMVTLFDMLRDAFRKRRDKYENDEGEVTFWSATSNSLVQLVENTAGLFIGADTIIPALTSIFTDEKYYSHELIAIETLNDIIDLGTDTLKGLGDFAGGLLNIIREDGDAWKYVREDGDFRGVIKDAAEKLAHYFTGVPVENVERLITNTIGWIFPQVEAAYDGLWSNGSKKALAESNALDADIKGLYNGRADISDETASELARLYEAGYKNAIMSDTPPSLNYDGEEYKLSAAQQQTYDETVRRYLHPLDEMMQSTEYLSADDETKAKMVNRFYDYAKDMAKAKVIEGYEVEGFAANVPEWRDQGISWGRIMSGDTQDNTRYAKYVTAGVNEQDAAEIFDTVEALEPEFGHDNVTAQQKVMAISYLPISESSKQAAMKVVYGNSEAAYDRYMISCNHGVASADYADFLNILEGIDKNGGNPNQAEFTEAINRSRIDADTARDLWYNGYGWKKTSPWG